MSGVFLGYLVELVWHVSTYYAGHVFVDAGGPKIYRWLFEGAKRPKRECISVLEVESWRRILRKEGQSY